MSTLQFYANQLALAANGAPSIFLDGEGGEGGAGLGLAGMNKVLSLICDIMRYAGIAMLIYGIYEVIMSVQNNQPEAKTKGVIMALSGVVMISIKTVVTNFFMVSF